MFVFALCLLQKLWLEDFDAFLVTNNVLYGLSDNRNDTPESVTRKQRELRVPSTSVIYHEKDGTVKSMPPHERQKAVLG